MKSLTFLRRAVAPLVLATALWGCGGHGSGSKPTTPEAKSAKAFASSNVAGTSEEAESASATRAQAVPSTQCAVQFGHDNTDLSGVASFYTGSVSTGNFQAYSADLKNLTFNVQSYDEATQLVHGTVTFDLTNFSSNSYFTGKAKYTGTYTVDKSFHLNLAGILAGPAPSALGTIIKLNLAYQIGASNANLTGTYHGAINFPNPLTGLKDSKDFSGATLAKIANDGLHLNATIPFTNPATDKPASIVFKGTYTHSSVAGSFNPSTTFDFGGLVTVPSDAVGQVYIGTADDGKTFAGSYSVLNADGTPFMLGTKALTGTFLGFRGTSTNGGGGTTTTSNFATGYYDGGIKAANGALNGQILKLNVVKVSSTAGANGALIIKTGSVTQGPNVGARIATITGSGNDFTLTADGFTSTYSKMVITGTISGSALNATYTGTLLDGSTVTGSFDSLGKVSQANASLNGTYTGALTPLGSNTTTPFTGVFTTKSDGTLTIATSSSVQGIALPAITGYVAGTSIAVKDSSEGVALPSPYTGDTLFGNFDGEVSGGSIAGKYVVFLNNASGAAVFAEYGSLALTKG